jgi:hypothetical protein
MRGAIPPLHSPSTSSWRGVQLKITGTNYLYLIIIIIGAVIAQSV